MNACSIKGTPYESEYKTFMSEPLMVYVWNANNEQPLDKVKIGNEVVDNPLYTALMAHPITEGDRTKTLKLITDTFKKDFTSKYTKNEQGLYELEQVLDYVQQKQAAQERILSEKIQSINIPTSKAINFYNAKLSGVDTEIHFTAKEGQEIFDTFQYLLGSTASWEGVQKTLYDKHTALHAKAKSKTITPTELKQLIALTQIVENFELFKNWYESQDEAIGIEQLEAELGDSQDWKTKEKSQKERATKKIVSLVTVLPTYRNSTLGEYNFAENRYYRKEEKVLIEGGLLGLPKAGDFQKNWSLLSSELSGITDYVKMYDTIEKLSLTHPQFKDMLSRIPNPRVKGSVNNIKQVLLAMGIKRIFSNPEVVAVSVNIAEKEDGKISITQQIKGTKNIKNLASQLDKQNFLYNKEYAIEGLEGTEFNLSKFISAFDPFIKQYMSIYGNPEITNKVEALNNLFKANPAQLERAVALLQALGIGTTNRVYLTPNYIQETTDYVAANISKLTALYKKLSLVNMINAQLVADNQTPISIKGPLTFINLSDPQLFPDGKTLSDSVTKAVQSLIAAKKLKGKVKDIQNFLTKKETELKPFLTYFSQFDLELRPSSYLTAEDKKKYIRSPWFFLSQTTKALNEAADYEALISTPGFERFDYRKNPDVLGSLWLNKLFGLPLTLKEIEANPLNSYKKQSKYGEALNLQIRDYNGTEIKIGKGKKVGRHTTNQHAGDKVLQDFFSFFQSLEMENIRFGDKSSAFSTHLSDPNLKDKIYVPLTTSGLEGLDPDEAEISSRRKFLGIMQGYLESEFKRVLDSLTAENRGTTYDKYSKNLFIFNDILPAELIEQIKKAETREALGTAYKLAIRALPQAVNNFFTKEAEKLVETLKTILSVPVDKTTFESISDAERLKQTVRLIQKLNFINPQLLPNKYKVKLTEQGLKYLAKNYLQNGFIHNVEFMKMFVGDLSNFNKTDKDAREIFKRIPFTSSPGDAIFWDSTVQEFFDNDSNQDAIGKAVTGLSRKFSPLVRTVIYNDVVTFSESDFAAYKEAYDSGVWDALSEDEKFEYDAYVNKSDEEANAQGVVTLDFYRNYLIGVEGWSDAQEEAYNNQVRIAQIQQELKSNPANAQALLKEKSDLIAKATIPFPPLKLGHYGPIVEDPKLMALHKFSLVPLVPSAAEGKQLAQQMELMYRNQIDYYTFKSGSKMAQYGKPIEFYKEAVDSEGNKVKVVNDAVSNDNVTTIHLQNLRQQQYQAPKFKNESTLATQMMKLLFGDFYEYGELSDDFSEPVRNRIGNLYQEFKKALNDTVQFEKLNLEKKLGVTRDANGQVESVDQLKLARFLANEFEKQELSPDLRSFIQVNEDGTFKNPLDAIKNREAIESLILNLINNKIISQKVHGESYIQVAGTAFETKRFAKPTAEQLLEFGANELQFYRIDPITGETLPMEVKVGFNSKKHGGLLKLDYQGKPVGTLEKLNQILKSQSSVDVAWREQHMDKLTMVGVRIPVQGFNSMEHVIVKEFLPESAGAIMVLPAQIVVKSGGDYDIDKLTFFETAFDGDGDTFTGEFNLDAYKSQLDRQVELKKAKQQLISLINLIDEEANLTETYKHRKELYNEINQIKAEVKEAIEAIDSFIAEGSFTPEERSNLVESVKATDELKLKFAEIDSLNRNLEGTGKQIIDTARAELKAITKELDALRNTKKAITNNLVSVIKNVLSTGELYDYLVAPNNNNILTQYAKGGTKITTTNVFNPLTSWRIYAENILSKDALGIDAKINTLQKEFQRANLKYTSPILNAYYLKANKDADGNILLGGKKDQAGNRISKILSEYINGHVDIAKEDWIILLGMNEVTSPLAHSMIIAGTPIEDVLNFIKSEPVQKILELSDRSEIHKKLARYYVNKQGAIIALVKNAAQKLNSPGLNEIIADLDNSETKLSNDQVLEALISRVLRNPEVNKYLTNFNPNETDLSQAEETMRDIAYALQFGVVVTQSEKMLELTSVIDFNTANYRTTFQSSELLKKESSLSEYFNQEALNFMFNDSALAQFNVGSFTLDVMTKIFPLTDSTEVHDAINRYLEYSKITTEEKRREAIVEYKNNFLFNYIMMTASNEKGSLLEYYRGDQGVMVKGTPNNLASRFESLLNNPDMRDNFVLNNLYIEPTQDREIIFQLKNTELDEFALEYREAFLEGLNHANPQVREFFQDLGLGAYMQFGPHFESRNVSSIVPHEVYVEHATKAYNELMDMKNNKPNLFQKYLSTVGFASVVSRNNSGPMMGLPSFMDKHGKMLYNTITSINIGVGATIGQYETLIKAGEEIPSKPTTTVAKSDVSNLFESNPELANDVYKALGFNESITPKQKQQAQQLYSQYLDTVFPDSKVRDIVYHGAFTDFISEGLGFEGIGGYHFGTKKSAQERLDARKEAGEKEMEMGWFDEFAIPPFQKDIIYPVILNIKSLDADVDQGDARSWARLIEKRKSDFDAIEYYNQVEDKGSTSYVVFEPEQIYILGSNQDIEGFKKFVSGQPSTAVDLTSEQENMFDESDSMTTPIEKQEPTLPSVDKGSTNIENNIDNSLGEDGKDDGNLDDLGFEEGSCEV